MSQTSPRISIRPARAEDREAVLAFSQNTFDWGDYLPFVWDDWLKDPSGKVLVATTNQSTVPGGPSAIKNENHGSQAETPVPPGLFSEERPVAVARVALLSPTEAWLEGLRVDPARRRQGVAILLTRRCIEEARALGAKVIRFVTASTNYPIHRLAASLGFAKVISLSAYRQQGLPLRTTGGGLVRPRVKDVPRLLAFLKQSPVLAAMGGLCKLGWTFQTLTEQVLKDRMRHRRLKMVEQDGAIGALAITGPTHRRRGISAGYLDGRGQALLDLIAGLRAEAASHEPPELTIWVPEVPWLKRTLFEAGFTSESGRGSWVYEKKIVVSSE